nr:retrotransposon Gag domain-containing protein [Tanacetum cinerariifolium]
LNDNIPKFVEEIMNVTTFLKGEAARPFHTPHEDTKRDPGNGNCKVQSTVAPPMTGLAENRNKNEFCEFHGDKGHSTDKCIHLRKQIEEAVKRKPPTKKKLRQSSWSSLPLLTVPFLVSLEEAPGSLKKK